jgi:hypothetical protein
MSNYPNIVVDSWNFNTGIRMGIGIAIPKKKRYECEMGIGIEKS